MFFIRALVKFRSFFPKKKKKEKEEKNSFLSLLRKLFLKKKKNLNPQNKKKALRKKKQKSPESDGLDDSISSISKALQKYEEFIQKDFFMIIQETKALLREWRSNIVALITAKKNPKIDVLSTDLIEIEDLYRDSERMLNNFVDQCVEYQAIVKDANRSTLPQTKLTSLQFQVTRIRGRLEKGRDLTDLQLNKDYRYLAGYVRARGR
ncbi:MAG: hypothetical protein AABY27_01425 [Pseudomonadota bacterium]